MEKKDRLSINQIKERYINEWVLLLDPDISEVLQLSTAKTEEKFIEVYKDVGGRNDRNKS